MQLILKQVGPALPRDRHVCCISCSNRGGVVMTSRIRRREFMAALGVGLFAAPAIVRAEGEPIVIRAGALKLIHSIAPYFYDQFVPAGYKIEVLPFETPTECKNAVVTKSVDFGAFGIAAALLGAAAGEPVVVIASTCNRGMAIIAKKDSGIASIRDLKGKRVAVFPGTTQEVFFLERLRMEGMTIRDVEPVRVSFSEMHIALSRGDIDAYVGAEPGPGDDRHSPARNRFRIDQQGRHGRDGLQQARAEKGSDRSLGTQCRTDVAA